MLPFIKNLALSALNEVLTAEPAFANEVIGYLETKAGPALSNYVQQKAAPTIAGTLDSIMAKLEALEATKTATPPANVIPLPGDSTAAPAASSSPTPSTDISTTPTPSAPAADASAPVVVKGHP